jgi:TetR/AcrR family transcriptional regulator, transcriptional repressor for nem operon
LTRQYRNRYRQAVARPQEFERGEVVAKAVDVFWAHGYEATSVDELTAAMGIGRGSLYNTFGDKHLLFLEALDCYGAERRRQLDELLGSAPSARAGVEAVLRQSVERLWADRRRRGCLLVNAGAELAASDPDVARRVRAAFDGFTRSFAAALEGGRRRGELASGLDVQATARALASTLVSLRLLSKFASRRAADDIVAVALRALD